MNPRILAASAIVSFGIGLVVASFAGFREFLPALLEGTLITVEIAAAGSVVAIVMAFGAAMAKLYGPAPLRWLSVAYIEVFRGTSALVQLFWMFYVLPLFGVTLPGLAVAVAALGLNVGAYGAEVVRGAVLAVPRGQWEAATALNFTRLQTLRRVVIPQAFLAMIPPWGNLLIELLKATSLVSLITIGDLAFRAQQLNQTTYRTAEIFAVVMVIYFAIAVLITLGMRAVEAVAARGIARGRTG